MVKMITESGGSLNRLARRKPLRKTVFDICFSAGEIVRKSVTGYFRLRRSSCRDLVPQRYQQYVQLDRERNLLDIFLISISLTIYKSIVVSN